MFCWAWEELSFIIFGFCVLCVAVELIFVDFLSTLSDFLLSSGGGPPPSVAHIFRVQFQSFLCSALSQGWQYISFCLFLLLPFHDNIWHRRSCKKYIYLWYIYQSYKILSHKNCESFFLLALNKIFLLYCRNVSEGKTTTTTAKRGKKLCWARLLLGIVVISTLLYFFAYDLQKKAVHETPPRWGKQQSRRAPFFVWSEQKICCQHTIQ